jgi:nitrogen fixation protein FixH
MRTILVIVALIGISAVLGAVIVGSRSFDGTVVEKPYEHGLAYDAAHHERVASGWKTEVLNRSFITGLNRIEIVITDRDNRPLTGAEVGMKVSRPSSSQYDKSYKAATDERGRISTDIDLPLYGYWNLELKATDGSRTVSFERLVFAEADTRK